MERKAVTLWEVDIHPAANQHDRRADTLMQDAADLGLAPNLVAQSAFGYLLQGKISEGDAARLANELFADPVIETPVWGPVGSAALQRPPGGLERCDADVLVHVLPKPGVTDPVAQSALGAIQAMGIEAEEVLP